MKTRVLIYTLFKAHSSMDYRPNAPNGFICYYTPFIYLFIIPSYKAEKRRGEVGGIFFFLCFLIFLKLYLYNHFFSIFVYIYINIILCYSYHRT